MKNYIQCPVCALEIDYSKYPYFQELHQEIDTLKAEVKRLKEQRHRKNMLIDNLKKQLKEEKFKQETAEMSAKGRLDLDYDLRDWEISKTV